MARVIVTTTPTKVLTTRTYVGSANGSMQRKFSVRLTTHVRASSILVNIAPATRTPLCNLLDDLLSLLLRLDSSRCGLRGIPVACHPFMPCCIVIKASFEATRCAGGHRLLRVLWMFLAVLAIRPYAPAEIWELPF
jgi:hypothetical protein